MLIDKILNNNVVLSHNDSDEEIILMGRGLAFQKKIGDQVDAQFIEKEFVLKDSLTGHQMAQVFNDVPSEEIDLAKKIIDLAEKELQVELSTSIYLTLTDHLHYAIKRMQEGIEIPNPLLLETQRFYPKEFAIAEKGLALVSQELGIELPESEAGFIAFHIVNSSQGNDNMQTTMQMTEIVRDILSLISRYFGKTFDNQSLNYQRIVTHLQYFAQRYLKNELSDEQDEFLFTLVQSKYPKSFQAVQRINEFLEKTYHQPIGQAEMIYLTIHIDRVVGET
uniref:BglG family transcription antiterminator LicT n=1 Tax=Candidatus Enterococcus willemsii TaxID=1857215 RepID=UPI00403F55EE